MYQSVWVQKIHHCLVKVVPHWQESNSLIFLERPDMFWPWLCFFIQFFCLDITFSYDQYGKLTIRPVFWSVHASPQVVQLEIWSDLKWNGIGGCSIFKVHPWVSKFIPEFQSLSLSFNGQYKLIIGNWMAAFNTRRWKDQRIIFAECGNSVLKVQDAADFTAGAVGFL